MTPAPVAPHGEIVYNQGVRTMRNGAAINSAASDQHSRRRATMADKQFYHTPLQRQLNTVIGGAL